MSESPAYVTIDCDCVLVLPQPTPFVSTFDGRMPKVEGGSIDRDQVELMGRRDERQLCNLN